jgi:hypothetical protein
MLGCQNLLKIKKQFNPSRLQTLPLIVYAALRPWTQSLRIQILLIDAEI